jgi:hypothetical protein
MRFAPRQVLPAVLACVALFGCSLFDQKKEEPKIDPNLFPVDYRAKIVGILKVQLRERSAFTGALISPPALKPFGTENRYVVCVRIVNGSKPGEKMAAFFGGELNQFIDADQGVCAGAAYEPFRELEPSR